MVRDKRRYEENTDQMARCSPPLSTAPSCGLSSEFNLPPPHLCQYQAPPRLPSARSHRSHCVPNRLNFVVSFASCQTFWRKEREIGVKSNFLSPRTRPINTPHQTRGLTKLNWQSAGPPGSAALNSSPGLVVFTARLMKSPPYGVLVLQWEVNYTRLWISQKSTSNYMFAECQRYFYRIIGMSIFQINNEQLMFPEG